MQNWKIKSPSMGLESEEKSLDVLKAVEQLLVAENWASNVTHTSGRDHFVGRDVSFFFVKQCQNLTSLGK